MKKVNFKKVLMALAIALTFLFLGVEQAGAQTISGGGAGSGLSTLPQGNFVDANEAQIRIESKMVGIKTDLYDNPSLPQSVVNAMNLELNYYEVLGQNIKNGMLIPKAIVNAVQQAVTDAYGASQSAALLLKQNSVDLLTD